MKDMQQVILNSLIKPFVFLPVVICFKGLCLGAKINVIKSKDNFIRIFYRVTS